MILFICAMVAYATKHPIVGTCLLLASLLSVTA